MHSKTPKSPFLYLWLPVALLWLVALLNYLDRLLITSMRESIEASIPMTEAQFGLLTSVFLWVYASFSPFAGFVADRFSRRWVIIFSVVVWSAFTWMTAHAHTFVGLLCVRAGMGLSEACYIPAALALITDYHRGPTRSFATGLHMSGIYTGTALGGIGGFLAQYCGWRVGFSVFGLGGVLYALLLLCLLRDCPREDISLAATPAPERLPGFLPTARELLILPGFVLLIVLNLGVSISNWLIYGWLPTYLREHFSLGLGAAGLSATGYIQAAAFLGVIVGGKWADFWAVSSPRGRMYVPAIGYLLAAPALFLVASTNAFTIAMLALLLFGLGKGFYDANLMPVLREISAERNSATGYGILNATGTFAGGFMTYIGGALRDRQVDLSSIFKGSAVAVFVTGLLLLNLRSKASSSHKA